MSSCHCDLSCVNRTIRKREPSVEWGQSRDIMPPRLYESVRGYDVTYTAILYYIFGKWCVFNTLFLISHTISTFEVTKDDRDEIRGTLTLEYFTETIDAGNNMIKGTLPPNFLKNVNFLLLCICNAYAIRNQNNYTFKSQLKYFTKL